MAQDAAFRKDRPARTRFTTVAQALPAFVTHTSMGGPSVWSMCWLDRIYFRLIALSAPFGLRLRVPAWKRGLVWRRRCFAPACACPMSCLRARFRTTLRSVAATTPTPGHPRGHGRWFTEALAAQSDVRVRASRIVAAVLYVPGTTTFVDTSVSQQVFDRLGASDKTLTSYPGLYHEIFNELQKDRVFADLTSNWLNAR